VHEALLWMGYATVDEARPWSDWIAELAALRRVELEAGRFFAPRGVARPQRNSARTPRGPGTHRERRFRFSTSSRARVSCCAVASRVKAGWCSRRLLARITGTHSIVFERRSNRSAPQTFCGFLPAGSTSTRNTGSTGRGESPTSSGSSLVSRYPQRRGNRAFCRRASALPPRMLDEITLSGEMAWGRLWGSAASPIRSTPVCIVPRDELETWTSLSKPADAGVFGGAAREIHAVLTARGAMFPQELARASRLLAAELDVGLGELVAADS